MAFLSTANHQLGDSSCLTLNRALYRGVKGSELDFCKNVWSLYIRIGGGGGVKVLYRDPSVSRIADRYN